MVCSKREEAETATSSSKRKREELRPINLDKLVRCKFNVIEGAVTFTLPVCEFWEWRALIASEMGLPGKEREY